MGNHSVKILCSGLALGVYVPGLLLYSRLKKIGLNLEVYVLESLLPEEKKNKILENKISFHRNFKVALIGQKLTGDFAVKLDNESLDNLLNKWKSDHECRFIVLSGYWLPVLVKYIQSYMSKDVICDLCHLDSVESTSWKTYKYDLENFKKIWIFNRSENRVNYYLDINNYDPISFHNREYRLSVHGGGWGMGTYANFIPELNQQKFSLNVVTYEFNDLAMRHPLNDYFMIDPNWKSWETDDNNSYIFPPFGKIDENDKVKFSNNTEYHNFYDLTRKSLGIISKPGGGTLLDSLNSATPLIMTEPYGYHEKENANLWEKLGFGVRYQIWKKNNFSLKLLETLHKNILQIRMELPEFGNLYKSFLSN